MAQISRLPTVAPRYRNHRMTNTGVLSQSGLLIASARRQLADAIELTPVLWALACPCEPIIRRSKAASTRACRIGPSLQPRGIVPAIEISFERKPQDPRRGGRVRQLPGNRDTILSMPILRYSRR